MFLKIIGRGFALHKYAYLRNAWNWLDFLVVVLGWVRWFFFHLLLHNFAIYWPEHRLSLSCVFNSVWLIITSPINFVDLVPSKSFKFTSLRRQVKIISMDHSLSSSPADKASFDLLSISVVTMLNNIRGKLHQPRKRNQIALLEDSNVPDHYDRMVIKMSVLPDWQGRLVPTANSNYLTLCGARIFFLFQGITVVFRQQKLRNGEKCVVIQWKCL